MNLFSGNILDRQSKIIYISICCFLFLMIFFLYMIFDTNRKEEQEELLVFAAVSLTGPINEIIEKFEKDTGVNVNISFGASQSLAQQIVSGAPASIFLSAGIFPIEFLKKHYLYNIETINLVNNKLVLALPADNNFIPKSLQDLDNSKIHRIAIANPKLAPAGQYSKEALESQGIWEILEPKIVFAADVRTTLAYIESGNVDIGIVYSTDVLSSDSIMPVDIIPAHSHSPIVYPMVVIKHTDYDTNILKLIDYLKNPDSQTIFEKYGFINNRSIPD